jgi:hypothetical protein
MAKKADGANKQLVTTVAVAGGVFVLRRVLATVWTKVTGKVPPTDFSDRNVTLPEALAFAVVTWVIVEAARFVIVRLTTQPADAEAGPS